jgi:hypothetical protein
MKHIGLALAAVASLAATTALAAPQDETIAYSARKPQPMVAGSSLRNFAFGAVVGFVADRVDGGSIAREYDVRDPQDDIAYAVASELAARRGVEVADGAVDLAGVSRRALASNPPPGRYLVDVESTKRKFMWSLIRGQWTRYTVGYRADLAVLDIPNQELVVRDHCSWSTPKAQRASRARLLDNNAEELKVQFGMAAEACTEQFIGATQDLWRREDRRVSYEQDRPRTPRYAPVEMAPLPIETRAPVYYDAPRRAPPPPPVQRDYRAARPVIVEYPYARPYEAPPSRAVVPDNRYAGRDANGYPVWPAK